MSLWITTKSKNIIFQNLLLQTFQNYNNLLIFSFFLIFFFCILLLASRVPKLKSWSLLLLLFSFKPKLKVHQDLKKVNKITRVAGLHSEQWCLWLDFSMLNFICSFYQQKRNQTFSIDWNFKLKKMLEEIKNIISINYKLEF
jgi:hypothetical protein